MIYLFTHLTSFYLFFLIILNGENLKIKHWLKRKKSEKNNNSDLI